ncbi:guanylate kinase [Candidatus Fermentibacteria bacterium]|nr:MAG: guanylate kinase [Candidatus Fermentibacteria bacterium]
MFSSGTLVVIAGPSGAGKTTLARHLVKAFERITFSVSATTRAPRGEEVDGEDYFFISHEEFSQKVEDSFFLEWAEVHGNRYGTPGRWVREKLASGYSVVLDIDVQGAVQVKKSVPSAVLVFVLPKSRDVLLNRLKGRNTDSEKTIEGRMEAADREVSRLGAFDYFVENRGLEQAQHDIETIFTAERMKLSGMGWPDAAVEFVPEKFRGLESWKGKKIVVSSGPTREMIDDVRFISNRSSGLMGVSLAEAFLAAGAEVTLVSGPAAVMNPPGAVELVRVQSAVDMKRVLQERCRQADLLVMAAAVSDYAPEARLAGKLKRSEGKMSIALKSTEDVLAGMKGNFRILAFALEYGNEAEERAAAKMERKGADAVFLNRGDLPGQGMESSDNAGSVLFPDGSAISVPMGSKRFVAFCIAAALGRRFS